MKNLSSLFIVLALLMLAPFIIRPVSAQNDPPVAEAGWDMTVDEGSLAYFDGSGSYDPDGTIESYEWDFGDASPKEYGITVSHIYADNGVYTVELVVTDNDGLTGADTCTVTVANVAPTVDAGPDITVDEGALVALNPAIFEDPGFDFAPITVETFTATISWGDGTSEPQADIILVVIPGGVGVPTMGTVEATHAYGDSGVYTVTVTVNDDDGGSGSDTFTVTVYPTGGVPEFPIGLALEIAFIPLVIYIWWKRKRKMLQ